MLLDNNFQLLEEISSQKSQLNLKEDQLIVKENQLISKENQLISKENEVKKLTEGFQNLKVIMLVAIHP